MSSARPIERPEIIVPDTGPLIHLAQADALHLLHQVGRRVVVTDMVAHEATDDRSKPCAQDIQEWLDAGQAPGSNSPVSVETTEVGRAFFTARKADPEFRWKGAAKLSMVEWLTERLDQTTNAVLVVYENGRVLNMIGGADIGVDLDILTTRAFLELAELREIVPSAEAYWRRISEATSSANPKIAMTMFRRPNDIFDQEHENAVSPAKLLRQAITIDKREVRRFAADAIVKKFEGLDWEKALVEGKACNMRNVDLDGLRQMARAVAALRRAVEKAWIDAAEAGGKESL